MGLLVKSITPYEPIRPHRPLRHHTTYTYYIIQSIRYSIVSCLESKTRGPHRERLGVAHNHARGRPTIGRWGNRKRGRWVLWVLW